MTAHRKIKDTAHIVYEHGTDHLRFMLPVQWNALIMTYDTCLSWQTAARGPVIWVKLDPRLKYKSLLQAATVFTSTALRRCGEYHTGAAVITQVPLPLGVFSHRNTSPSVINGDNRNKRRSALANEPGKADETKAISAAEPVHNSREKITHACPSRRHRADRRKTSSRGKTKKRMKPLELRVGVDTVYRRQFCPHRHQSVVRLTCGNGLQSPDRPWPCWTVSREQTPGERVYDLADIQDGQRMFLQSRWRVSSILLCKCTYH
ncbi:hypothetical protein Bbelb_420950 [Branchiostoma belcheri]|nr:hypothetical protein Bbelb_420950 [Branchiostoma belcheri]